MDYQLAALKVFSSQLKHAKQSSSTSPPHQMTLFGILFQRAWIQGDLVSGSEDGRFLVDDGTGIVELSLPNEFLPHTWIKGMYVMVVGMSFPPASADGFPLIKVHKIVDLSSYPDREALWNLEVIEAYKLFYLPLIQ